MIAPLYVFAFLSLMLSGAIFGFFYAWVCSTMWGLDATDPTIAIRAMQAMNASVRNAVFAPAFFGTPLALLAAATLAFLSGLRVAGSAFLAAGFVYLFGGIILTLNVSVPMNQSLAAVDVTRQADQAQRIWQSYSQPWQFWNSVRTVASGITLALTGVGILMMRRRTA